MAESPAAPEQSADPDADRRNVRDGVVIGVGLAGALVIALLLLSLHRALDRPKPDQASAIAFAILAVIAAFLAVGGVAWARPDRRVVRLGAGAAAGLALGAWAFIAFPSYATAGHYQGSPPDNADTFLPMWGTLLGLFVAGAGVAALIVAFVRRNDKDGLSMAADIMGVSGVASAVAFGGTALAILITIGNHANRAAAAWAAWQVREDAIIKQHNTHDVHWTPDIAAGLVVVVLVFVAVRRLADRGR